MKKFLAALLCVMMVVVLMPTMAFADGEGDSEAVAQVSAGETTQTYTTLAEAIQSLEGMSGTITLLDDVEGQGVFSSGTVTLDLAGHQIISTSVNNQEYLGTITVKGGSLTINDTSSEKSGAVRGGMFAVVVQSGSLIVNGGTYGACENATLQWNEPLLVGGGTCVVNDGTFVDGSLEYFSVYGPGSLTVNGGRFDSLPYFPEKGGAAIWVAEDDGLMKAYATYADFAAKNSDVFTYDSATNVLTMKADFNKPVPDPGDTAGVFFNDDVTLDLAGHTWDLSFESSNYERNLMVINGGVEVTIMDSSENETGKITNTNGNVIEVMGTLNISGGTIEQKFKWGMSPTILLDGNATVNMSGGTITGSSNGFRIQPESDGTAGTVQTINITGGTISTSAANINLNDRGSASCEISGGNFNKPIQDGWCAEEYLPIINPDGTYTVQTSDVKIASVTDSEGNVKQYVSLGKALASANDGDTVMLLADIELSGEVNVYKKLTLDLAGFNITRTPSADEYLIIVGDSGDLTLKDSGKTGTITDVVVCGDGGSKITMEGGTINNANVQCGGTIKGGEDGVSASDIWAQAGSTITVNGGVIEGVENGVNVAKGTATLSGGTITGGETGLVVGYGGSSGTHTEANAIISETAVITGGTNGIDVKGSGSSLTVSGGRITGTEGNGIYASVAGSTSKINVENGIITGKNHGIYLYLGSKCDVAIAGGVITGETSAVYKDTNTVAELTGGTFSSDVGDLCAEDYAVIQLTNGEYKGYYGIHNSENHEFTLLKYDESGHWHQCECGQRDEDFEAHNFQWVIDQPATATEKGSKHEECSICSYAKAAVEIPASGSGGYYPTTPTVQAPTIEASEGVTVVKDSTGTTATITVADGYELMDVTVNGVSKGKVTTLTGLRTGDKVVVTAQKIADADDTAAQIAAVKNVKLIARSKMSKAQGKKSVKVYWYASDGSEVKLDGVEIFRSTKRYSGFGKKPFFTTTKAQYHNTAIQAGAKYYYKVRGYKVIGGEMVYTDWSTKAWRTVK